MFAAASPERKAPSTLGPANASPANANSPGRLVPKHGSVCVAAGCEYRHRCSSVSTAPIPTHGRAASNNAAVTSSPDVPQCDRLKSGRPWIVTAAPTPLETPFRPLSAIQAIGPQVGRTYPGSGTSPASPPTTISAIHGSNSIDSRIIGISIDNSPRNDSHNANDCGAGAVKISASADISSPPSSPTTHPAFLPEIASTFAPVRTSSPADKYFAIPAIPSTPRYRACPSCSNHTAAAPSTTHRSTAARNRPSRTVKNCAP